MGYCVEIEMDIKLKDMSKEAQKKLKKYLLENDRFSWDAIGYSDPEIHKKDNELILSGSYSDRYYEDDWHNFLDYIAPYVKDNELIECVGEDLSLWGFRFKNGTWKEVEGHIVYDD